MVPVAIALAVGIIFVEDVLLAPLTRVNLLEALGKNAFARSLKGDDFPRTGTFGSGILRMGAIDIETPAIRQHFVQLPVIVGTRAFPFPVHFEPARIEQRIFVFIIPNRIGRGQTGIMTDDGESTRKRDRWQTASFAAMPNSVSVPKTRERLVEYPVPVS